MRLNYKDFAKSLTNADLLFITDIYGAREKPIEGISSKIIVDECKNIGHKNIIYIPKVEEIPNTIIDHINPNDIIITMGAGNIWRQCEQIIQKINNESTTFR